MVAYLRELHSQLQTLTCLMTGIKQATVKVHVTVAVIAGHGLHCGGEVFVTGAAVIGSSLTGAGQHEEQVIESAEEAVQDDPCTVS